jgi:hypothetical protein
MMAKAPPWTAEELRAFVESHLSRMTEPQQRRFWLLITEHKDNWHHQRVLDCFSQIVARLNRITSGAVESFIEETNDLHRKLMRHRKPRKNADRDAEIVRLRNEGKTAGEIIRAMKGKFVLTDKVVNAVISREKKRAAAGQSETR